jgi:hypothetical protein
VVASFPVSGPQDDVIGGPRFLNTVLKKQIHRDARRLLVSASLHEIDPSVVRPAREDLAGAEVAP